MMDVEEIVSALRASVSAFNAGGSGDALAGRVTDLADELDKLVGYDQDEEPTDEYDPGPEVDDMGGMSEYQYFEPADY